MLDFNRSRGLSRRSNADGNAPGRQERADAFRPFNHDHTALIEQLGKADRFEIVRAGHTICVQVKDRQPPARIDIQENERRTAHRARRASKASNESADELRFTGTEIALKGNAFATTKRAGKLRGNCFCLFDTVGSMRHSIEL